jgi:hypothetical protein
MKRERQVNRKGKKKIKRKGKKKMKGHFRHFIHFIHVTQLGESVLSNIFPKRIQLHHRISSTWTATAGAATTGA